MKNKMKLLKDFVFKLNLKEYVAVAFIVIGFFNWVILRLTNPEDIISTVVYLILGILFICMGSGLYILSSCEKNEEPKDSVNMFIGKELFEKGLYGTVIGLTLWLLEKI